MKGFQGLQVENYKSNILLSNIQMFSRGHLFYQHYVFGKQFLSKSLNSQMNVLANLIIKGSNIDG